MALCAYIRCILVALRIAWDSRAAPYDVIIVDQVSAVIPFLQALTPGSPKILFYCHFPDLLLARRRSWLHSLYRAPLDWIEQTTTGAADAVVVNSRFTRGVFGDTFRRLARRGLVPGVLYPAVHPPTDSELKEAGEGWQGALPEGVGALVGGGPTFLSVNRFERKKNIALAVEALRELGRASNARLVIAGGYDPRLPENVEHLAELEAAAAGAGVADRVIFLPSFSDAQRAALFAACVAVLYTPTEEHFGIVPLEAMAAGRPVVACNSGGPLESVVHGETGFLCIPQPGPWAAAMEQFLDPGVAARMGGAARRHACANFSRAAFGDRLEEAVLALAAGEKLKST